MTDQSPADVLRAAASLMRERAQAATPGPWSGRFVPARPSLGFSFDRYMVRAGAANVAQADQPDCEYIIGMHPSVAVAVAAWLDDRATDYFGLSDVESRVLAGDPAAGTEDPAITVARTYLGDPGA